MTIDKISSPPALPLNRSSVESAHEAIKPHIHRTPVLTSQNLSKIASTPLPPSTTAPNVKLFFKCETHQRTGAFKIRGAFHSLSRLTPSERQKGVCTHSAGNHAAALALAARTYKIPAHIVMPRVSVANKIAATESYGGNITFSGPTSSEREAVTAAVQARTGAILIPPYDYADTILGQGTTALEFLGQVNEGVDDDNDNDNDNDNNGTVLDVIIAPLGGGGLLSGTALVAEGTGVRVFGAEPSFEGANDAERGFAEGKRVERVKSATVADGLRTPLGVLNWDIMYNRGLVEGVYSVGEEDILKAMRLCWERLKVVAEPSACTALAVVLFNPRFRTLMQDVGREVKIGIVLSGGNVDLDAVGDLMGRGKDRVNVNGST